MNRFMNRLSADGVALGYTEVTDLGDDITIPAGANEGLILNLALMLAPQYDEIPSNDLRANARAALKVMYKLGVSIGSMPFPSTLPIGSGNEQDDFNNTHFYPELADEILTESNGSILLEEETGND